MLHLPIGALARDHDHIEAALVAPPPEPEPPKEPHSSGWFLAHPYPMPPNFTGRLAERAMLDRWLDADAVHPGYGFLAESPGLAGLAREHGMVFVGPPTEAMALAGDKLAARAQAQQAGVPVLPGGDVQDGVQAR